MPAKIPRRLGRYDILQELGKGAMGIVYLAEDPLIGRKVALKTFRITYGMGERELEQFRARFLREAQSCGILNHPNIVTIHDVVDLSQDDNGNLFIAMEYVQGRDLKSVLQEGEPLEVGFVLDIVSQVADALDYAHDKNVVHRDVKPANVILTDDKVAKITDFGIARLNTSNLTQDGQLLGTPNYMAPEQVQGHEIDQRADIFALGVMLYEMLTHKKPFHGDNLTVVTHKIVHVEPPPLEPFTSGVLPDGIEEVIARVLAKSPADRYQRAGELAVDLRRLREKLRLQQDLSETQDISQITATVAASLDQAGTGTKTSEIPPIPVPPSPAQPASGARSPDLSSSATPPAAFDPFVDPSALPSQTGADDVTDLSASLPPPPPEATGYGQTQVSQGNSSGAIPAATASTAATSTAAASPTATSPTATRPTADNQASTSTTGVRGGVGTSPTDDATTDPADTSGTLFDRIVPPEEQKPLGRRVMIYLAVAVGLILVGIFVLIPMFSEPPASTDVQQWPDERMDWERQYAADLQQGRRLLESGQPGPSLAALREIRQRVEERQAAVLQEYERLEETGDEAMAAERLEEFGSLDERVQGVRDLLQQAEWRLEEQHLGQLRERLLDEELETARQAFDSRDYTLAMNAVERVLEVDPSQEEAIAIGDNVTRRLARQREAVAEAAPPPEPVVELPPPPPPPVRQPLPPPPTGPAKLMVDFEAAPRSGNVRVYLDTRLLISESFRVGRRDPSFKLSRSFEIPAGTEGELKVYFTESGEAAQLRQLRANFPAGSQRRLVIRVDSSGNFQPRLR